MPVTEPNRAETVTRPQAVEPRAQPWADPTDCLVIIHSGSTEPDWEVWVEHTSKLPKHRTAYGPTDALGPNFDSSNLRTAPDTTRNELEQSWKIT